MMIMFNRVCRIFAFFAVYVFCAITYLNAKGFIYDGKWGFILSNVAHAEENVFAKKVSSNVILPDSIKRVIGEENAPVSVFVFSSMACSHCREFHKNTLPKIEKDFVSKGLVKIYFVHFPLEAKSMKAAKASYCLPKENFYSYIDTLYSNRNWLFADDDNDIYEYAKKYGLSDEGKIACDNNKKLTSDILLVRENAIKEIGIQGTPSLVIETLKGSELIVGTQKYSDIKEYLQNRVSELDNERNANRY